MIPKRCGWTCFAFRLVSCWVTAISYCLLFTRAPKVSDSSFNASNLVFKGRCVRGGRINRINASSTAAGMTPSRNATSCTFHGSFVLMFEELMKANRAWRLQDTVGAAIWPARLLWSEPPPS